MPQKTSIKNSGGFTLIEVMVAIVIVMIGMMGLLETVTVSAQHHMRNQLRDEGVRVGERYMTMLKGTPFDSGTDFKSYSAVSVPTKLRGIDKIYKVQRTSQPLATDSSGATSRQYTVVVKWSFKNQSSVNTVVSVVPRP